MSFLFEGGVQECSVVRLTVLVSEHLLGVLDKAAYEACEECRYCDDEIMIR